MRLSGWGKAGVIVGSILVGVALADVASSTMMYALEGIPSMIRPEDVQRVFDSTGLLVGPQDVTPMGLAHHAISIEDEADQPLGGLMRRVLKTMKV